MPKAKDARADKAFEMYRQGLKLTEIASQLEVAEGTVRSWKNRYKWDGEANATLQKKKRNVAKKKTGKMVSNDEPKIAAVENSNLNEKQRLFCLYFVNCRNKVKAYQKAYQCSYENACAHASTLWKNVEVQKEINKLLEEYREEVKIDTADLFRWYLDIARADITDYVEFGTGTFQDTETGEDISYSYVNLKDSKMVDGTLISEVSKGKDGAKIKLSDRMKALQWLSEHIGLADEKQKAEIALLKAKADAGKDDREQKLDKLFEQIESELKNAE